MTMHQRSKAGKITLHFLAFFPTCTHNRMENEKLHILCTVAGTQGQTMMTTWKLISSRNRRRNILKGL